MKKTVELTAETGLCTSCGICKNICQNDSISLKRINGKYQPTINHDTCIDCGICSKVCPGLLFEYPLDSKPLEAVYGNCGNVYNAWSLNSDLRHVSASGGVVSNIIEFLLKSKEYDVAFCLDSYVYEKQLKTIPVTINDLKDNWKDSSTPKSRYLPVSHEDAVSYIKEHQDKKVIIIGTSCAIRGIRNVLNLLHKDSNKYLLIGLFCDKVFNYNIYDYYQNEFADGKKLSSLHFKNKDSGGWPGNMKLMFNDGQFLYLDKSERGKVKDYFMPERCLYCVDKLNVCADISLGDNYTKQNSSKLGSNSVIVRTQQGQKAWYNVCSQLEYYPLEKEELRDAQYLDGRLNNLYFAKLKQHLIKKNLNVELDLNKGIRLSENSAEYEQAWKLCLSRIKAGEVYLDNSEELSRQLMLNEKRNNFKKTFFDRVYYSVKRRIKKI